MGRYQGAIAGASLRVCESVKKSKKKEEKMLNYSNETASLKKA